MIAGVVEGLLKLNVEQWTAGLNKAVNSTAAAVRKMSSMEIGAGKLQQALGGLGVTLSAGAFLHSVYENTASAQRAMAQLEAGVRSTGGAAGYSAGQLADMAGSLQRLTGIEDETIEGAQSLLLTFTKIGHQAFPDTIAAAADLSVRMGGDIRGAVLQLGKALQDPIMGVSALRRSGISFSQSQRDMIKSLVDTNRLLEAQKIVLEEVKKEVGGSAEAFRHTMPGAVEAMGNAWGDLLEEVGGAGSGVTTAVEGIVKALEWMKDNWASVEAAVFETCGQITQAVTKMASYVIEGIEKILVVVDKMKYLNPASWFGAGPDSSQAIQWLRDLRQGVVQFGEDVKSGMGDKAEEALNQAAAGAKGLGKEFKATGDEAAELTEEQKKYADSVKKAMASARQGLDDARRMSEAILGGSKAVDELNRQLSREKEIRESIKELNAADARRLADLIREKQAQEEVNRVLQEQVEVWKDAEKQRQDVFVLSKQAEALAVKSIKDKATVLLEIETQLAIENIKIDVADAHEISAAFETIVSQYRSQMARLAFLNQRGLLSDEKYAAASNEVTTRFWNEQLGRWQDALGQMSGIFGGVFRYLKQAMDIVQSSRQMGQSVTNALQGMGVSANTASAAGGVMTVVGIFYQVYEAVSAWIKKMKGLKYGNAAELNMVGGDIGTTTLDTRAFQVVNAIKDVVKQFGDALGGTVTDLAKIGIQIRNDGKYVAAWVGDMMIGHFNSVDEAIKAALAQEVATGAVKISGISDLVREAMAGWTSPDFDSMMDFLGKMRQISDLSKSQGQLNFEGLIRNFDDLWSALSKMPPTAAVAKGFGDLSSAIVNAWQSWSDSITGRQRSAAEELAAKQKEGQLFNAQKALYQAKLRLEEMDLQAQLKTLQARGKLLGGGGGGGGSNSAGPGGGLTGIYAFSVAADASYIKAKAELASAEVDINSQYLQARATLAGEEADLYQQQVDALLAQINAIAAIISALPADIDIGSIRLPGGGGGTSKREREQGVRDFIDQKRLSMLGDYQRSLASIDDEYAQQIKDAGKNAQLLAQLNQLKKEELALLGRQIKADLVKPYVGSPGQRSQFSQQMGDIEKAYDDARKVAKKTGVALWQLNAAEQERLRILGLEAAAAAGSRTAQTILDMQNLAQTIEFLRINADKLHLSFSQLMQELQLQNFVALGDSLSSFVEKYYGQVAGMEGFKLRLEQVRAALELGNMKLQFNLLKAQGLLTQADIALIQGVFDYVDKNPIDWEKFFKGTGGAGAASTETTRSFASSVSDFSVSVDRLKEFTDSLLLDKNLTTLDPRAQIEEARRQFDAVVAQLAGPNRAQAIEDLPNVERALLEVMRSYWGSGGPYQEIFDQIIALNRSIEGAPAYGTGAQVYTRHLAWVWDKGPETITPGIRGTVTGTTWSGRPADGSRTSVPLETAVWALVDQMQRQNAFNRVGRS